MNNLTSPFWMLALTTLTDASGTLVASGAAIAVPSPPLLPVRRCGRTDG